jgi:hypothetical protein
VLRIRIWDPGSGVFLTPGSGIRDEPRIIHISESLETIFWVKIIKFFDADADQDPGSGNLFDPGSAIRDPGMEKIRIRDKHPRSAIRVIGNARIFSYI